MVRAVDSKNGNEKRVLVMQKKSADAIGLLISSMDEISKTDSNEKIGSILTGMIEKILETDGVQLLYYDAKSNRLRDPFSKDEVAVYNMLNPTGLLGRAFLTQKAAYYNYALSEKEFDKEIDVPRDERIRSILYAPIPDENGELLAIVRAYRDVGNSKPFTNDDLGLMESITPFLRKIVNITLKGPNSGSDIKKEVQAAEKIIADKVEELEDESSENTMMRVSMMVHDIRTPANALAGFLELLEERIKDKRILNYIHNARESADFINTLTTSILDSVKYGSSFGESRKEAIYTCRFFASIFESFTASMLNKHIKYHIYIDPSIPKEIEIDTMKMKRVLINIIGNAWKFTPSGKTVTVVVRKISSGKKMEIIVSDTGLGIEPEKQAEIFEAFKQIDDMDAEVEGSGLGLAIVKKYINEMDGDLTLQSKPGKGSIFRIALPLNIVNEEPNLLPYYIKDKKIVILTNNPKDYTIHWIRRYLVDFGLDASTIEISDTPIDEASHVICFENSLDDRLIERIEENGQKLIIVEETLLSLSEKDEYERFTILSKGTYYGAKLHEATYYKPPVKVLLVDDSKINIMLLEAVLENEYCTTDFAYSGEKAIELFDKALKENEPYQVVFLDKFLEDMDGDKIAVTFKRKKPSTKIVSTTGDPEAQKNLDSAYDLHIAKPFNRKRIQTVIRDFEKENN